MPRKARPDTAEVVLRFRVPKGVSAAAAKRLIWNNLTGNHVIYPDMEEAEVFGDQTIRATAVSARIIKGENKPKKLSRDEEERLILQVGAEVYLKGRRRLGTAKVQTLYDAPGGVRLDREIGGFVSWNVQELKLVPGSLDPGIAEAALLQAGKDPADYGYRSAADIARELEL